ncbi:MAG: c-type cytochrome [bacterium]
MIISGPAFAGDPAAGQEKSAVCAACHGPDGNSPIATNPRIAGQYADYLVLALSEYRSGVRQDPVMAGMAAALTDEDIADLAAWFSAQPGLDILPDGPAAE